MWVYSEDIALLSGDFNMIYIVLFSSYDVIWIVATDPDDKQVTDAYKHTKIVYTNNKADFKPKSSTKEDRIIDQDQAIAIMNEMTEMLCRGVKLTDKQFRDAVK